jgi:hypothetical protein
VLRKGTQLGFFVELNQEGKPSTVFLLREENMYNIYNKNMYRKLIHSNYIEVTHYVVIKQILYTCSLSTCMFQLQSYLASFFLHGCPPPPPQSIMAPTPPCLHARPDGWSSMLIFERSLPPTIALTSVTATVGGIYDPFNHSCRPPPTTLPL